MLHKVLQSINNLLQFAKLIRITCHIAHQNDGAFVVSWNNTYQFSWYFTYSTTQLWKSLPNETVLAVNQDHFIAFAIFFVI